MIPRECYDHPLLRALLEIAQGRDVIEIEFSNEETTLRVFETLAKIAGYRMSVEIREGRTMVRLVKMQEGS